jgi:hypothetical protein
MRGTTPDDPWITEMDPVQKLWMFENWLVDQEDRAELAKNHAYLVASFDHPDAVKQLLGEGNVHESTEEEFEESTRMVRESNLKLEPVPERKRKKRQLIKG